MKHEVDSEWWVNASLKREDLKIIMDSKLKSKKLCENVYFIGDSLWLGVNFQKTWSSG